jgi:glycosyltransferase involved in cell wall biosynthesis
MSRPLVTVCVVTYNQAEYVEQTVRSALEQDYPAFEVLVSDDASTDGTLDVINRLAAGDSRVVPIPSERNTGLAGNFNRALAVARGEYFAVLGGDDLFLPGKLSAQVAWLEEDSRRVFCAHDAFIFQSETGENLRKFSDLSRWKEGAGPREFIARGCPYLPSTVMLRRSAMPSKGFDERIKTSTEEKLYIETLMGGGRYGHIPGIFTRYRRHGRNMTSRLQPQILQDLFLTLDLIEADHPQYAEDCQRNRARLHQRSGLACLREGDGPGARSHLRNAIATNPDLSWKLSAWYGLSWAPGPVRRELLGWLRRRAVGVSEKEA